MPATDRKTVLLRVPDVRNYIPLAVTAVSHVRGFFMIFACRGTFCTSPCGTAGKTRNNPYIMLIDCTMHAHRLHCCAWSALSGARSHGVAEVRSPALLFCPCTRTYSVTSRHSTQHLVEE